jgi:predicted ATPase with chaperone activity
MLGQVNSFILQGIDPIACEVEVDVADRVLPRTTIVGLPDVTVKESIERVRSATINSALGGRALDKLAQLDDASQQLLSGAMTNSGPKCPCL